MSRFIKKKRYNGAFAKQITGDQPADTMLMVYRRLLDTGAEDATLIQFIAKFKDQFLHDEWYEILASCGVGRREDVLHLFFPLHNERSGPMYVKMLAQIPISDCARILVQHIDMVRFVWTRDLIHVCFQHCIADENADVLHAFLTRVPTAELDLSHLDIACQFLRVSECKKYRQIWEPAVLQHGLLRMMGGSGGGSTQTLASVVEIGVAPPPGRVKMRSRVTTSNSSATKRLPQKRLKPNDNDQVAKNLLQLKHLIASQQQQLHQHSSSPAKNECANVLPAQMNSRYMQPDLAPCLDMHKLKSKHVCSCYVLSCTGEPDRCPFEYQINLYPEVCFRGNNCITHDVRHLFARGHCVECNALFLQYYVTNESCTFNGFETQVLLPQKDDDTFAFSAACASWQHPDLCPHPRRALNVKMDTQHVDAPLRRQTNIASPIKELPLPVSMDLPVHADASCMLCDKAGLCAVNYGFAKHISSNDNTVTWSGWRLLR